LAVEVNADNIKDFITAMEAHRSNCEIDGRYVEAEMAKNRIQELKEQEFTMEYQSLCYQHQRK